MSLSKSLLAFLRLLLIGCVSFSFPTFGLQIGVVDEMHFLSLKSVSKAAKSSSDKIEKLSHELKKLYEELEERTMEFRKNIELMDEKTLKQIQGELINLDKRTKSYEVAIQRQRNIVQSQIEQKILDAALKLAKHKKLNLVLGKMKGVLYADPMLDMTQEMIRLFPQSETVTKESIEDLAKTHQTTSKSKSE